MLLSKEKLRKVLLDDYVDGNSDDEDLRSATIRNKRNSIKRFLAFLGDRPLTLQNFRLWGTQLKKSGIQPISRIHYLRAVMTAVRYLYREDIIDKDFTDKIRLPRLRNKKKKIVSNRVALKIIDAGSKSTDGDNSRNKLIKKEANLALRFILNTGLRNREARDLKVEDISFKTGFYYVDSKCGGWDEMALPKNMIGELKKHIIDKSVDDKLFQVTPIHLNECLKRGCKKLKIPVEVRVHTLRKVFCTTMLRSGLSIYLVSKLARHSSVKTTEKYYIYLSSEELSHSLNAYHPSIRIDLDPRESFKNAMKVLKDIGMHENNSFKMLVDETNMICNFGYNCVNKKKRIKKKDILL